MKLMYLIIFFIFNYNIFATDIDTVCKKLQFDDKKCSELKINLSDDNNFCKELGITGESNIFKGVVKDCLVTGENLKSLTSLINNNGKLDYLSNQSCTNKDPNSPTGKFLCHTNASIKALHIEESINPETKVKTLGIFSVCPIGSTSLQDEKGNNICWISWGLFPGWLGSSTVSVNGDSLIIGVKNKDDCPSSTTFVENSTYQCKVKNVSMFNRTVLYSTNLGVAISYPKDDINKQCGHLSSFCKFPSDTSWNSIDLTT